MDAYRPQSGTPISELDTPCLLLDMDALEGNFRRMAETYRDTGTKMREHTKNIKSPLLARMQMDAGGTVGGVCAAKVAEAEVMVEGGINDILIPNQVVTEDKIARLCSLAKRGDMKVAVDDPRNLQDISQAAQSHGVTIGVVIEVDTQMGRAGIRDIPRGVEIAKKAQDLPGVEFLGVMSHQTPSVARPDRETRMIEGREYIQRCLDVKHAIEAEGIQVKVVSSGETWTYDVATDIPEVTEIEGGTYAVMDTKTDFVEDFAFAAKILGTVISTPRPGIAVGDVGSRALAGPTPRNIFPSVVDMPGAKVEELHEEHIVIRTDGPTHLRVGDKFVLHSGWQDLLVNRWDQYIAVRNGVVEGVFDVAARGCHH